LTMNAPATMTSQQREQPAPSFARDGAERHDGAVATAMSSVRNALARLPPERAGVRVAGADALRPLLAPDGAIGAVAAAVIGPNCQAVRAPSVVHEIRTIHRLPALDVASTRWTVSHA
jgi:hypothetical protein